MSSEEKKAYCRAYYAANREIMLQKCRDFRQANLARIRASDRARYVSRSEAEKIEYKRKQHLRYILRRAKWTAEELEARCVKQRLASAKYYRKDLARNRNYKRAWNHAHPSIRRSGKTCPGHWHTKKVLAVIEQVTQRNREAYGRLTCYLCGREIVGETPALEHKLSLCRGGVTNLENCDLAHAVCNASKGKRTPDEYFRDVVAVSGYAELREGTGHV